MQVFQRFGKFPSFASPEALGGNLAGARAGRRLRIAGGASEDTNANQGSQRAGGAQRNLAAFSQRALNRIAGARPADGVTTSTRSSFSQTSEGPNGTHSFESDVFIRRSADELFVQRSQTESYSRATPIPPAPEPPVEPAAAPEPVAAPAEVETTQPASLPAGEPAPAAAPIAPAATEIIPEAVASPLGLEAAPPPPPPPPPPAEPVEPVEPRTVEPASEASVYSRSARRETTFEVVTGEGDQVSISLESNHSVERYRSPAEERTTRVNQRSVNISVEGDLSSGELSDIRKLLGGFDFGGLPSLASYRYSSTFTHEVTGGSVSLSA